MSTTTTTIRTASTFRAHELEAVETPDGWAVQAPNGARWFPFPRGERVLDRSRNPARTARELAADTPAELNRNGHGWWNTCHVTP